MQTTHQCDIVIMLVGNTNEPNGANMIRRFDIAFEFFWTKMGPEDASALRDGQDVTDAFSDDIAAPVKAVIVNAEGPGGGNPYVEFTFQDEDHSWEWASSNMDMEPADYEFGASP